MAHLREALELLTYVLTYLLTYSLTGDRDGALAHLREALELHRRAYGEGTPHVNKAAVISQLANLSLQAGERDRAAAYLQEADLLT